MGNPARYELRSNSRERSGALWGNVLDRFNNVADNQYGQLYWEDFDDEGFVDNTTDASEQNGWFIQDMAAGGTSESLIKKTADFVGGAVTLSAGTGTAHFGIEAHRGTSATAHGGIILPSAAAANKQGVVVYETRINLDISELHYIGLTEPIVAFLGATSALPTDSDYIGFYKTAGGDLTLVCANDNDGGTAVTDSATLIEAADLDDGYYKLGFRVNPDLSVIITVNDRIYKAAGDSINPAALPIEFLTPKYALGRGGGSDTTVSSDIDWIGTFVGRV